MKYRTMLSENVTLYVQDIINRKGVATLPETKYDGQGTEIIRPGMILTLEE